MARREKQRRSEARLRWAYREFLAAHRLPQALFCEGLRIYAPSGVYHPHPRSSSRFMLARLPEIRDARVLDMGTGTGVIGLYLAAREFGNDVTLTDVDPAACAAAEINAMVNDRWARVVRADVWEGLPARERYDVVIWNLPLLDKPIEEKADLMACDPGGRLARRFLDGLPGRLARGGRAYVLTSSHSAPLEKRLGRLGLSMRVLGAHERASRMEVLMVEIAKRRVA